jgi:transposase-like protein
MTNQRSFSIEFKRQVVQDLLTGESRPAQLCRRYNISSSLLYHWKRQYSRGKFDNEPTAEAALKDRVEKLERLVGKLTLENEFLKKGLRGSLSQSLKRERSSPNGAHSSAAPGGGANS